MWVRGPCSSSTRLAKGLPVLSRAADHNGLGRLGRRPSRSVEMPAAPPGRATKVTAVVKREVCFVCFGDVKRNRKKRKQSLYYIILYIYQSKKMWLSETRLRDFDPSPSPHEKSLVAVPSDPRTQRECVGLGAAHCVW